MKNKKCILKLLKERIDSKEKEKLDLQRRLLSLQDEIEEISKDLYEETLYKHSLVYLEEYYSKDEDITFTLNNLLLDSFTSGASHTINIMINTCSQISYYRTEISQHTYYFPTDETIIYYTLCHDLRCPQ